MLIPSIDLYDGKAVQWRRGKEHVLEREDVFELLEKFRLFGDVAIVDLNAATGKGDNRELIERMLRVHPCRVGGGIRDLETARHYLKAGAAKIMIGTAAREPWVRKLPREALIFAIDSKGDFITKGGWQDDTDEPTEDVIDELAPDCGEFLYTQVEKEGMMQGLDRARIEKVVQRSSAPVTVAGGITSIDDIRYLNGLGANAQIGMALYTGALSLEACFVAGIDWEKMENLVPTVVQDVESGQVLMMAYSTPESLAEALRERAGVYHSRRRGLWRKGETSGHVQELVKVDIDCDGDTLLFQVRQRGNACHFPRVSCFASQTKGFDLHRLDATLERRKRELPEGSYSTKLFQNPDLLAEKLREETEELVEAADHEHARWEAADLLFFTLAMARSKGVSLDDIVNELRSRHGNS